MGWSAFPASSLTCSPSRLFFLFFFVFYLFSFLFSLILVSTKRPCKAPYGPIATLRRVNLIRPLYVASRSHRVVSQPTPKGCRWTSADKTVERTLHLLAADFRFLATDLGRLRLPATF